MLKLQNITKRYKDQVVLNKLNLGIYEKEMISIMGKSGVGKSTLFAIMAGLVKPDEGTIIFKGRDITDMDEESLAEFRLRHIGFIFQDFKLIPSLTVYDNILLGIYPRKDIDKEAKQGRVMELSRQVGLNNKLSEKVDNLSGGEKQRVAIARSLVNKPTIVLADEPTGNLDSKTAEDIMELFDSLYQTLSTTFLIVTHDQDIADRTQKVYNLNNGGLTI